MTILIIIALHFSVEAKHDRRTDGSEKNNLQSWKSSSRWCC